MSNGIANTPLEIALLVVPLVLPVCIASGAFFPLVGTLMRREIGRDAESVGVLTMANTFGAVAGSLAGGFILLPYLGIEVSNFVIGLLLVANGFVDTLSEFAERRFTRATVIPGLAAAVAAILFPFGLMRDVHVQARTTWLGGEVAAVREGLTETLVYLRYRFHGETTSTRMATNRHSMASNKWSSRRYMKLFTWLPLAVHPEP